MTLRVQLERSGERGVCALVCLFALTVALCAYNAHATRRTEAAAIAALERELDDATGADEFSGTVTVARCGVPIFERAYNRADREHGVANTLATAFNVGSMNKMMTAVAVMRLVQDGRLGLSDTVGKYIPDYPNRAIADHVTIHQLLTHTGGTGDIFDDDWDDYRLTLRTHADYVKRFGARAPNHPAGARFDYSNFGFVLLGAIVERVTGRSYYDAVAELVYAPAHMTSTTAPLWNERIGAIGYTRWHGDELAPNIDVLPYRGMAAGGGWSTTRDLLAFANALEHHVLLDHEHTALLTTSQVRIAPGFDYGYGFAIVTIDGVRCVGHGGGFPGANGELLICESGYTIAMLANFDPPTASDMAVRLARRLPKASGCE
jgi:CubicO group peptidase (beta-lactamase class C family)